MLPETRPSTKGLPREKPDKGQVTRILNDTQALGPIARPEDQALAVLHGLVELGHPDQGAFVDMMAEIVDADVVSRESGQREKDPYRHENVEVLIKTRNGHVIGVRYRDDDYQVSFPRGSFTKRQVLDALARTYPDSEAYSEPPPFLPWEEDDEDSRPVKSSAGFEGIRFPLEGRHEDHGQRVRALWLSVRDRRIWDIETDTLSETDGRIEYYYFPQTSLGVKVEGETFCRSSQKGEKGQWVLHPTYIPKGSLPQLRNIQQRLGIFLGHLLGNGDVIDDSITSLSVSPNTFHTPMTPSEASSYSDYHLEEIERFIAVRSVTEQKVKERKTSNPSRSESGKYVFTVGENEFGILTQRYGNVLMSSLYTQVRLYPEGLPFSSVVQEIERMRTI